MCQCVSVWKLVSHAVVMVFLGKQNSRLSVQKNCLLISGQSILLLFLMCHSVSPTIFLSILYLIFSPSFWFYRVETALVGLEGRWKELGGELHPGPSLL